MKWHTEQRAIDELIPHQANPRQMTGAQNEQLEASLKRFDLAEIPAINTNNKILAGHQRLRIMKAIGRGADTIDVRVPDRELTADEENEYLVRSNKNVGEWNWDELANNFEVDDLKDWGFADVELAIGDDFNPQSGDDQPRLDEKKPVQCPKCKHEFIPKN